MVFRVRVSAILLMPFGDVSTDGILYIYTNGWEEPFELEPGKWNFHPFGIVYEIDEKQTTVLPWHVVAKTDILYE